MVLDFGGSTVKRAVALARGGVLERLEMLAACPAPPPGVAGLTGCVVETIADTLHEAERAWGRTDPLVTVSIASYVVAGRPVAAHGTYGSLGRLDRRDLEAAIQLRTGASVRLEFLHDGTAAARGLAQPGQAGLIVLGTFLAAGFPPAASRPWPTASQFGAPNRIA